MQYWGMTDPGCVRTQNQDTFHMEELERSCLLCVVCDGMGGAKSGNVASSLACDVFSQTVKNGWRSGMGGAEIDALLSQAAKLANFTVYDQGKEFEEFTGMGTTLVAALVRGKQVTIANIGDSRAYHIGGEGITQVTVDHSIVQLMITRGELTPEEGRNYPGKNLITRAVGTEPAVECDIFHLDMEPETSLLLCSDGLSNLVEDQEILFEVVHGQAQEECCRQLVEIAINRGAPDNVTCVLVQF